MNPEMTRRIIAHATHDAIGLRYGKRNGNWPSTPDDWPDSFWERGWRDPMMCGSYSMGGGGCANGRDCNVCGVTDCNYWYDGKGLSIGDGPGHSFAHAIMTWDAILKALKQQRSGIEQLTLEVA